MEGKTGENSKRRNWRDRWDTRGTSNCVIWGKL